MPDQYFTTEQFTIEVNNSFYYVDAFWYEDNCYKFKISNQHGYLTTLIMNDDGAWQTEHETLLERNLIEAIGKAIEKHDA